MGYFDLPKVEEGRNIEETVKNLFDAMYKFKKELEFLLANIDSSNIGSIDGAHGVLADPQTPRIEDVQDIMASTLKEGTGIDITYDDTAGTITLGVVTEDIQDIMDSTLKEGKGIDIVYDDTAGTITTNVDLGTVEAPAAFSVGDGDIAGLTISNPPTQAEVQALRDKCEMLADDCRALRQTVADLISALGT